MREDTIDALVDGWQREAGLVLEHLAAAYGGLTDIDRAVQERLPGMSPTSAAGRRASAFALDVARSRTALAAVVERLPAMTVAEQAPASHGSCAAAPRGAAGVCVAALG